MSTIGLDENKIRKYVKYQEEKERQEEGDQQEFDLFYFRGLLKPPT